ncbi:MAG: hypothetical protein AUH75_07620 [Gemmatimonadetes bacterium 13_1_40CM_4_65_7]|nr:MAG: hypothetical protein AUH75_07620 [Gemmatimonadetes bacterium 13_1_40CM_4_65_7]
MGNDGDPAMSRGSPFARFRPRKSLVGAGLVLVAACGSDSLTPAPRPISVSIVPLTVSLLTSGSQDFTATVANDPTNSGVTWSITGCTGGPGVCGSLSNVTSTTAAYTAPATVPPSGLGITATAVADNTKSFTAGVTITAISASGQIAFISDRDRNLDIYLMNVDGPGVMQLTNDPSNDTHPDWSPDGTRIVFTSFRDGNAEIYAMNADGSNATRLTNNPAFDGLPAWSLDGTRIVFTSLRDGNKEIYVMNADGSNPRNLTNNPGGDDTPAWSPDGTRIAFTSARDGNWEIYVMNADGSNATRLTDNGAQMPAWSPDGTRIAFTSARDGNWEIYVMNADGSDPRNLTNSPDGDFGPAWSLDGTKIAFDSHRDGNEEIYVMNADGSSLRNLTNNPAADGGAAWRPQAILQRLQKR